jgi:WD40 repeat protein
VNFKDTIRSAIWSRDGNLLCVFPMRNEQPARVFTFDGTRYVEKGTIPEATAGAFSPDDRWLATVSQGARVQLRDAQTLQPAPETPERKTTFAPDPANPEARVLLLRFSDDGQHIAVTVMREPARLWDLRTGKMTELRPKWNQDQIIRVDFATGSGGEQRIAAGMNGMVGIWDTNNLKDLLAQPILLSEPTIYPVFNQNGTKLLTLSGPLWGTLNTVRVWDTSFRKPVTDDGRSRFDGKNAPPWLADLAEAMTGVRVTTDEDDKPPPTIADVREKHAGKPFSDQYQIIWDRFLKEHATAQP